MIVNVIIAFIIPMSIHILTQDVCGNRTNTQVYCHSNVFHNII